MKLRNQLLALACLAIFLGFGVVFFRAAVLEKPRGIIVFISDSMVARHLTAARLFEGGAEHRLTIDRLANTALVSNYAREFAVPDDAAAATAIATGEKVNHRNLGVTPDGRVLTSLGDIARSRGRAVGIVTTGHLTDPGPAAFYAHHRQSKERAVIAAQFAKAQPFDLVLGGGLADFLPTASGGNREDGLDLFKDLARGRTIVRTKAELEAAVGNRAHPLLGFFSMGNLAYSSDIASGSGQPSLSDMVRAGIETLRRNRRGYLLIVDSGLATRAAEANHGEHLITETLALDRAIRTALEKAGRNTLIIAVGKLAAGGFSLNGYPFQQDRGVALLGTNPAGYPSITWATGPNGPEVSRSPEAQLEPAAHYEPSALHTAEDVIAAGIGPGSEKLQGFIDNTRIFEIIRDAL